MDGPARRRRGLTYAIIGVLSASTATIVVIIVADLGGETAGRALATAGLVIAFTLAWLLSAMAYERGTLPWIGVAGMIAAPVALALALLLVWDVVSPTSLSSVKPALIAAIVSTALAWSSAVVPARGRSPEVDALVIATVALVLAVAGILIASVVTGTPPGVATGRAVGVMGALAVLGTFLVPLVSKLRALEVEGASGEPDPEGGEGHAAG